MSYNCERLFFLFWNGLVTKTMELSLRVSLEMKTSPFHSIPFFYHHWDFHKKGQKTDFQPFRSWQKKWINESQMLQIGNSTSFFLLVSWTLPPNSQVAARLFSESSLHSIERDQRGSKCFLIWSLARNLQYK